MSRARGFASATAFIRYAVMQELSERQERLTGAEERIAATLNRVRKDAFRVARAQQAFFAYLDTLTKALLTCLPEPPDDARPQEHSITRPPTALATGVSLLPWPPILARAAIDSPTVRQVNSAGVDQVRTVSSGVAIHD